jgi:hypothetical protein
MILRIFLFVALYCGMSYFLMYLFLIGQTLRLKSGKATVKKATYTTEDEAFYYVDKGVLGLTHFPKEIIEHFIYAPIFLLIFILGVILYPFYRLYYKIVKK